MKPHEVTYGIMAALPVELGALIEVVDDVRPYKDDNDPNDYRLGRIPCGTDGQSHSVVLMIPPRDGTQLAATCCAHMLRTFPNIQTVIMTGIAGGIPRPRQPGKHVRLGDIVIAHEGIVNYGNVRREDGTTRLRGRQGAGLIAPRLLQAMNELKMAAFDGDRRWERWLDPARSAKFPRPGRETDVLYARGLRTEHPPLPDSDTPENMPQVHYGVIGSADTLMADEDFRDELAEEFPDMFAVEMEGSGVAAGTSLIGKDWFMVRGVADYSEGTGKRDTWHRYASYTAAAYVRVLLETTAPIKPPPRPQKLSSRPLVDADDQQALDAILREVPSDLDLEPVWRQTMRSDMAPDGEQSSAESPTTPAEAFHRLAGRNAGASGLNPAIALLARLAEVVRLSDTDLAHRLDTWITGFTKTAGMGEALRERLRSGSDGGPAGPGAGPALVIEMEVCGIDREEIRVTSLIQDRTGPWSPRPLREERVRKQQIEDEVSESIARAEQEWARLHTAGEVDIEFVLPCGLMNLPVQWYPALRMGVPRPIGVRYPVAVRSQERMREASVRREWATRWGHLGHEPFDGRVQWGVRYQAPPQSLDAWSAGLSGDEHYVVVVLSESPDTELGLRELFAALEAGVPVILWDQRSTHQGYGATEELRRLASVPATLPERMHALRVDAAQHDGDPHHSGRSVALLWDDPNRVVGAGGEGS